MKWASWMAWTAMLGLVCGGLACSPKPETLLQADRLIGSTPEELIERLGEPKEQRAETSGSFGFLSWDDIEGTRVLVIVRDGKGRYVSYQFKGMESFDEQKALELIGVELPDEPPEEVPRSRAKRWQPFGPYERLTINPDTRLISVGTHPASLVDREGGEVPSGSTDARKGE